MAYASNTSVPVSRSIATINDLVTEWGAQDFGYLAEERQAMVSFFAKGRRVRFVIPLPNEEEVRGWFKGKRGYTHRDPSPGEIAKAKDQEIRRKWRSLGLAIKARLVAVDDKVETFEQAFLAHVVDPSTNRTISELVTARIEQAYTSGKRVKMLPEMED